MKIRILTLFFSICIIGEIGIAAFELERSEKPVSDYAGSLQNISDHICRIAKDSIALSVASILISRFNDTFRKNGNCAIFKLAFFGIIGKELFSVSGNKAGKLIGCNSSFCTEDISSFLGTAAGMFLTLNYPKVRAVHLWKDDFKFTFLSAGLSLCMNHLLNLSFKEDETHVKTGEKNTTEIITDVSQPRELPREVASSMFAEFHSDDIEEESKRACVLTGESNDEFIEKLKLKAKSKLRFLQFWDSEFKFWNEEYNENVVYYEKECIHCGSNSIKVNNCSYNVGTIIYGNRYFFHVPIKNFNGGIELFKIIPQGNNEFLETLTFLPPVKLNSS